MNYTIENDILTIIQAPESQKPNTTHPLTYALEIMNSIQAEIVEHTKDFNIPAILEAVERLELYRPMFENCSTRLQEIAIEEREARRLLEENN